MQWYNTILLKKKKKPMVLGHLWPNLKNPSSDTYTKLHSVLSTSSEKSTKNETVCKIHKYAINNT